MFFKSAITFLAVGDIREAQFCEKKNRTRQDFVGETAENISECMHSDIFENFDKLMSKTCNLTAV